MIAEQLTGTGQMGTHYLQTCTYSYHNFASPALDWLNPFQLIFGRAPKSLMELETTHQEGRIGSFKEYNVFLRKSFDYFQKIVHEYRLKQLT